MLALSPRGAVSSIECFSSPKKGLVVILVLGSGFPPRLRSLSLYLVLLNGKVTFPNSYHASRKRCITFNFKVTCYNIIHIKKK